MIINIDTDGTIELIASQDAAEIMQLGEATKRRASHVEPQALLLRAAFHAIRALCSDESRLAAFTRSWRCLWRVNIIGGPILPGRWRDRAEAIAAEVEWIEQNQFGAR